MSEAWRDTFDDVPGWKDGPGPIELLGEDGTVVRGYLDFDEGGGDGPAIELHINGEISYAFFDFLKWRPIG